VIATCRWTSRGCIFAPPAGGPYVEGTRTHCIDGVGDRIEELIDGVGDRSGAAPCTIANSGLDERIPATGECTTGHGTILPGGDDGLGEGLGERSAKDGDCAACTEGTIATTRFGDTGLGEQGERSPVAGDCMEEEAPDIIDRVVFELGVSHLAGCTPGMVLLNACVGESSCSGCVDTATGSSTEGW